MRVDQIGLQIAPIKGNKFKFYYPKTNDLIYIEVIGDSYYGVVRPSIHFNVLNGNWPHERPGSFYVGGEIHRRIRPLNETEELLYSK